MCPMPSWIKAAARHPRLLARAWTARACSSESPSLRSPNEITGVIDAGDALLVLRISDDFERVLAAGGTAPLQLIT